MANKTFARFVGLLAFLGVILLLLSMYVLEYASEKWSLIAFVVGGLSLGTALFLMKKFPPEKET